MGFAFTFGGGNAQKTGNSSSMRALAQLGMEERRMQARQQEVGFNQALATKKFNLTSEAQSMEQRIQEQAMKGEALRQTQSKQEAKDAWEMNKARSAASLGIMTQQETMAPMTQEMQAYAGATRAIAARFPEGSPARAQVYADGAEQIGMLRVKQHIAVSAGNAERGLREMQQGMAEDGMDAGETALVKRLGEGLQEAKQVGDLQAIKAIDVEVFNAKQAIARDRTKTGNRFAAMGLIGMQIDTFLQASLNVATGRLDRGAWMRGQAARSVQNQHKMAMYDEDFVAMQEVDDALYGRDKGRNLENPGTEMSQQATDKLTGRSGQADRVLAGFQQQAQEGTFDPVQAEQEVSALPVSDEEKNKIFDAMLNDPAIAAAKGRAAQEQDAARAAQERARGGGSRGLRQSQGRAKEAAAGH